MALRAIDDRTRLAILAAGALSVAVLAACVERQAPAPPGQPARLPNEGFLLNSNADEGFKLAYGQDGTDNTRLMLECRPGSRKIDIFDLEHPQARRGQRLTLASGELQSVLMPTLEPDEDGDGVFVVAHATPDLPTLDGFRRSGVIAVKLGARSYVLSATPGERAAIVRFFSGCERK